MSATQAAREHSKTMTRGKNQSIKDFARQLYDWQMEIYSSYAMTDLWQPFEYLSKDDKQNWYWAAEYHNLPAEKLIKICTDQPHVSSCNLIAIGTAKKNDRWQAKAIWQHGKEQHVFEVKSDEDTRASYQVLIKILEHNKKHPIKSAE